MLRLTEIKLPIDHSEDEIRAAILERLRIQADELISFAIFKRSVDARKTPTILFIYTLDVTVTNEAAILGRFKNDSNVGIAPDTSYRFVAQAPPISRSRPVIIGMGPAGL